jgi:hypothetical protein
LDKLLRKRVYVSQTISVIHDPNFTIRPKVPNGDL